MDFICRPKGLKIHGSYDGSYQLCLVRDGEAFFACGKPSEITGDDWNDSPAGSNAGHPRNHDYFSVKIGEFLWCPDHNAADEYNHLKAPWLILNANDGRYRDIPVGMEIYAGIRFDDFVRVCAAIGSHVCLPVEPE